MQLTHSLRPRTIESFIGLENPKKIARKLRDNPTQGAYLFVGEPGLGKTTLALAIAETMPAELHHIPSQECNLETLRKVVSTCHYVPRMGCKAHVILVDEADQMTNAAQLYLLSKLDATAFPPNTIFIFTCNSTDGLEARFLSRCRRVDFSSYGNAVEAAELLRSAWVTLAPAEAKQPNFARVIKEACGNVRAALMELENLIDLA
jgi:replication-associated recombination protein RarA